MKLRGPSVVLAIALLALAFTPAGALPSEKDRWVHASTDNFEVYSNGPPRRAMKIAENLERLREVLIATSQGMTANSPMPTTIYVFRSERSFNPYRLGADGKPEGIAGYFIRTTDGNYVAIDGSEQYVPYGVIFHEYLHYFMENNIPGIPLWLNEGIAEFYSSFAVQGGKAVIGQALDGHMLMLARDGLMPLTDMFEMDTSSPDYNEGERQGQFYAQSWLLTHYLLLGEKRRGHTGKLFKMVSDGVDSATAIRRIYGVDLQTLQAEMAEYVVSNPGLMRYTPQEPFEDYDGEMRDLDRAEVLYRLGDLLAHHPPILFEDAEAHLRGSLELEPSRAETWVALAGLKRSAEEYDEAVELCEKALELDPDNPTVRGIYGQSLLARYIDGVEPESAYPESTPPDLEAARAQYRAALEQNPSHLASLIGLGTSYLFTDGDLTEGRQAMIQAFQANPADTRVLANLIILTARSDNTAAARSLLERSLRPRGEPDATRLAEMVIVETEFAEAKDLAIAGNVDEAITRVEALVEETRDPDLRRDLEVRLDIIREAQKLQAALPAETPAPAAPEPPPEEPAPSVPETPRELFDEATRLAQDGETEEALELLARVSGESEDADLRQRADARAAELAKVLKRQKLERLYSHAVAMHGSGAGQQALGTLEKLLADPDLPADMKLDVEEMLRQIRGH